jgi:hypothetical protein
VDDLETGERAPDGGAEPNKNDRSGEPGELVSHQQPLPPEPIPPGKPAEPGLPPDWPDARGFHPPGPTTTPLRVKESAEPVLRHTKTYNGNDQNLTTALASYVYFRDDARFGGWQGYLQRSDDFIRFCCHMHICEMLTARGGAGQTRVVWRWPISR